MGNITRRNILALGLGATSTLALGTIPETAFAQQGGVISDPPPDRPDSGVKDMRAHFADITSRSPIDPEFRASFIKRKIHTANTHPSLDPTTRKKAVQGIIDRTGPDAALFLNQPPPGGVGYGVFYTPDFKTAWGLGTSISFDIVCPQPPGGNVDTFLYLTATNRSALGVEAFVLYYAQNEPRFRVFDWAQGATSPWQTDIPFSELSEYLAPPAVSNNPPQELSVWNTTVNIGGNRYRNEVLLYNHVRHGWDLVYQYDYPATDEQQKIGWIGSWSPVVETFQSAYDGTRPMGAMRTLIRSADNRGNWGSWAHLDPSESYLRTDDLGFRLRSISPNFAFIVAS